MMISSLKVLKSCGPKGAHFCTLGPVYIKIITQNMQFNEQYHVRLKPLYVRDQNSLGDLIIAYLGPLYGTIFPAYIQ